MTRVEVHIKGVASQSMRCRQVESLFDVPVKASQQLDWSGDVPIEQRHWNVGLIVGPSGSGKTTVARSLFGAAALREQLVWGASSVLDDFPADVKLAEIASICQAVGFNTIPAWLRRFDVLSNGEQFRVSLARKLLEARELTVVDEFTSVVDRQVAKIGSHAVQKFVRARDSMFVAVSCHHDIIEWLNPDWILEPATMSFAWRDLQRRPSIDVVIARVEYPTWRTFARFHYLSAELNKAAQCFALFIDDEPAAFGAMLYRPHPKTTNVWGLSRLVTLPDYQGLGLAFVLADTLGAAFKACQQRMHTYPAHPALMRAFDRSKSWLLEKKPGLIEHNSPESREVVGTLGGRPKAVFSYCGPAMKAGALAASEFLDIPSLRSHIS